MGLIYFISFWGIFAACAGIAAILYERHEDKKSSKAS